MKKILLFLILPLLINSCYTVEQAAADKKKHQTAQSKVKHAYEYEMIQPAENSSLDFEDSTIASRFE